MTVHSLRFRQIHLDFHTSQHIAGIGSRFDPDQFADTLAKAAVNSITCFARCHHGYIYYPSKINPERVHPHLKRNLLGEQIEACHKRDIRVPIYITVQWDQVSAEQHPEWCTLAADGKVEGTPPFQPGFYRSMAVNSPYLDFLKSHVKEVLETFDADGLFFDIVNPRSDASVWSRKQMIAAGLDPSDDATRAAFGVKVIHDFKADMTRFIRKLNKRCTIFYNSGHIGPRHRSIVDAYSHLELESLPSGGWGYLHFPLTMRYARNLGPDCMGMTGKFHTTWGDFHSFKNQPALAYECFTMLALNGKCSVGDQLPPDGKICPVTYDLIGSVYRQVAAKEPWCENAKPVTDIAVLTPEEFATGADHSRLPAPSMGATRILQEAGQQFDIIDSQSDFSAYKLLILPDTIPVDAKLAAKLDKFINAGGAMLLSNRAGLDPAGARFASETFGVQYVGPAPFSPDFIMPTTQIGSALPRTGHVMYQQGTQVSAIKGATVLAGVQTPYFNRTWEHFCSHNHAPSSGKTGYPAVVRKDRVIYFAHPIFSQYADNLPRWCKTLVLDAIAQLLAEPVIRTDGPGTLLTAVNDQPAKNRRVVHLLHYIPERRGQKFDTIEDVIPLHNLAVSVRADRAVKSVKTVPQDRAIDFTMTDTGRVEFTLDRLDGHQMIELAFAPGSKPRPRK